eukprot:TRINITY_DN57007_c0_g1_i1.p1 TRINITY_DN57007_c0_g1~~TRINITY_DN57007_c0_g1_i1.p1  ORF type:complete len:254 (+),score=26.01 TRINITY_DN57007_c0_g1_i1:3-764(+)
MYRLLLSPVCHTNINTLFGYIESIFSFNNAVSVELLKGTPLAPIYLRMLGAKMATNILWFADLPKIGTHKLTVGQRAIVVGANTFVEHTVVQSSIQWWDVQIGADVHITNGAGLHAGYTSPGVCVHGMAVVCAKEQLPTPTMHNQVWTGVPTMSMVLPSKNHTPTAKTEMEQSEQSTNGRTSGPEGMHAVASVLKSTVTNLRSSVTLAPNAYTTLGEESGCAQTLAIEESKRVSVFLGQSGPCSSQWADKVVW